MKINMRRMNRVYIVVVSARQMSHAFVYDINKQARIENEQQQQLTYQCVGFFFFLFRLPNGNSYTRVRFDQRENDHKYIKLIRSNRFMALDFLLFFFYH